MITWITFKMLTWIGLFILTSAFYCHSWYTKERGPTWGVLLGIASGVSVGEIVKLTNMWAILLLLIPIVASLLIIWRKGRATT